MATFFEAICLHAARHPERDAFVNMNLRISFGELPGIIEQYERCLSESGILANSVVGIRVKDEIVHLLISLALLKMRADQTTLMHHDPQNYCEDLARRVQVSDIVSIDDHWDPKCPALRNLDVVKRSDGLVKTSQPNNAPTIYATTSGTTGRPRIVPRSERIFAMEAGRFKSAAMHGQEAENPFQNILISTSVEHHNVKLNRLRAIYTGATSVFIGGGNAGAEDLADLVVKERVGMFIMSIPETEMFGSARNRNLKDIMMRQGVTVQVAGARISWATRKAIQENFCDKLYIAYGSTETLRVSQAGPGEHDERECVGRPLPNVDVEIVDEEGRVLPPNEIGEIRIRAPGTVTSYFDDPEETAKRFRDGWFYPGDMASLTDDGQLIIHGRKDDMMNLNSIKIYPAEIERVFETHPEVAAAAAFPIKSKIHGDIPAVALELVKGSRLSEQDLMQYARDRLGIRSPRRAIILDALPKNAGGKVLKTEIAAIASGQPAVTE